jgi:ferredoxin
MLYINPDECIDCDQCIEACPITAIMKDTDAPQEWCDKNRNFPFSEDKRINDPSQVTHGPNYDPNHPNLVG